MRRVVTVAFFLAALLLTACASRSVPVTVTAPAETVVVTATPSASPSPSPPPTGSTSLHVCVVGEPDTLYLYGGSQLPATRHVMEALYDGPIDYRDYTYQPVILEKLPRLADGDAVTDTTYVREGDRVVDAAGDLVTLEEGVDVRPSGCYTTGCEVTFESGLLRMDRMEVTFALQQDLTWSDGEPLTAADSVFGFEVASDPATPGYRHLAGRTAAYRAVDEWTTEWVGVPGFMDPSYFLNFFPPLPRHQLEERTPGELTGADATRRTPLGWGPFVVEEWVRGDHIALSRNPHYFRADESLPRVDRVVFEFTDGAPEMVAALLAGDCDVAVRDPDTMSLMPFLVRAEQRGLLNVASAPGDGWEHLNFNLDPAPGYESPAFFADVDVRQAVAMCIDRQAIVEEVAYGRSVVPDTYLPPGHPLYPEGGLARWEYDPVAGRALLGEKGWRDEDGDGVREAYDVDGIRDGEPFQVTLSTPSDAASSGDEVSYDTARIIRAQLADCGIQVTLETMPRWELMAPGPDGPLFGRRFDMAEATRWLGEQPPCEWYLSSRVPGEDDWDGPNVTGYRNSVYDDVCLSARQALPGTLDFERYHQEAQIIFSHHIPSLPLFMRLRVALARPGVENFEMDPTAPSELWNLETLDVGSP